MRLADEIGERRRVKEENEEEEIDLSKQKLIKFPKVLKYEENPSPSSSTFSAEVQQLRPEM